jgi:IS5 family transposase
MVTQHIGTLREYNAKFRQQSANSVDAGSALLFEPLSESMHAKHALLSQRLGWNKIDMRPRRCLTDCRSVVRIVLTSAALYTVRHHRRGRDHARIESALSQFATPVVGTTASLHRDQATDWQISAPKQELFALQCTVSNDFTCGIHSVNLYDMFRQVDADSDNLVHGTSPSVWGLRTILQHTSHGNRGPLPGSGKSLRIHIGADADSGLVHSVRGTAGHVADIAEGNTLLHGQESVAFGDAGYRGIDKRTDAKGGVTWHVAMRPGKRRALNKDDEADALIDKAEKLKAAIRAKVEHPFRVIKRQFGFVKVRYRGLAKNTAHLKTLFALSNLWMVRHKLMGAGA